MWKIDGFDKVAVELDFSASEQGRVGATAIDFGGVRLSNAIELVGVEPGPVQVEVCECCGCPDCKPGGCVALRRIGDHVVWVPAWEEMAKGAWEESWYQPPAFLSARGAPVFGPRIWEQLRALCAEFPGWNELIELDSREAARLLQWTAPGRVLGAWPAEPRLDRELVLAVTEGDLAAEIEAFESCLRELFDNPRAMEFTGKDSPPKPIEFWLELPGTPGWKALARVEGRLGLWIDETTALVRR